jgi:hypothetical protein
MPTDSTRDQSREGITVVHLQLPAEQCDRAVDAAQLAFASLVVTATSNHSGQAKTVHAGI